MLPQDLKNYTAPDAFDLELSAGDFAVILACMGALYAFFYLN